MRHHASCRQILTAVAIIMLATTAANAGGLAVREQSAYGEGSSYAGVAAGGSLSSMFWNPAIITQAPGLQTETVLSGIIPSSTNNVTGGTLAALGGTGNIAHSALVPSSYTSYQLNDRLWLGLSSNAPFGLMETFPDNWAGRLFASNGENLRSYNFAPTVAYKINDMISVGAGLQIQYASLNFAQGLASPRLGLVPGLGLVGSTSAAGMGYGFTAGVTVKPTPTTTVGLGYRSWIDQKLNGAFTVPAIFAPAATAGSINATAKVPGILSLGLRQQLTSQWTALGTIEWTNWSRTTNIAILQPNGAQATLAGNPVFIPLNYRDGWFFSLGAEYDWTPQWALRGGVGFEKSPVSDTVRNPVIPDNDRTWLSIGATYKYNSQITIDFAYSHVFVKNAAINIVDPSNPIFLLGGGTTYTGNVDSRVDILSVGLKYRFDTPAPPAKLITKG
jgi:long-chain fatty acid transport protein